MAKRFYMLVLTLLFVQDLFAQCAMCKAVAEEEVADEGYSGINTGILYIMAIPYIILFFVFRKKIFAFLKDLRKAGVGHPQ
jgi:hypothetical protein